jgi:pimeloyl-ACP methyl ester carboxylesterase
VYVTSVESLTVQRGNVRLHVNLHGEGPTALLLHGWPDTSALWDDVVPELVGVCFRVAVPDLRGCGRSDKPSDLASYKMHHLIGDVASIVAALGDEKVTLVGHDWGANLAWAVAAYRPELVERLCVVSVGHPRRSVRPASPNRSRAGTPCSSASRAWVRRFLGRTTTK